MAGHKAGIDTVSEDTFDIPTEAKFEWYMEEQYGSDT